MASENAKRDDNRVVTLMGVTDDASAELRRVLVDPSTGRIKVSAVISTGGGITSLNGLTGGTQTFTNDTNVTIVSGGTAHVITWSGQLSVARGGTGAASLTGILKGNGTSAFTAVTAPTGDLVGTSDSQTLTNKTLGVTNTITAYDSLFTLQDQGDATKQVQFQLSGITTGNTRTLTVPDASGTMTLLGNASTGSGSVVLATSPTLTTPVLGVATATSINKVAVTAPATSATLTLADGSSLVTSGANSITLTSTAATNVTLPTSGTLATLAGSEELDNKTLDSSVGKGTWTASGTWTLPAMTFGGNVTLAENVSVVLDPALSADGKYCGITEAGTAGETLAFGDLVYFKAADSRWWLTDADADATAGAVMIGMCVLAAASGGDATTILRYGKIRADAAFPTMTVGAPLYISTTAGDIQTSQPSGTDDVIRIVGHACTADELMFNPSNDYITHT